MKTGLPMYAMARTFRAANEKKAMDSTEAMGLFWGFNELTVIRTVTLTNPVFSEQGFLTITPTISFNALSASGFGQTLGPLAADLLQSRLTAHPTSRGDGPRVPNGR